VRFSTATASALLEHEIEKGDFAPKLDISISGKECLSSKRSSCIYRDASSSSLNGNTSAKGWMVMKGKLNLVLLLAVVLESGNLAAFAAAGAVYTLNNSSTGNAVLVFSRTADGHISPIGVFPTGGKGTGKGLGNQGALAIDAANRLLFAINAGSDSISVFRIQENGLALVDVVSSGGKQPISLSVSRNVLYVLNNGATVGASDTVAGFSVGKSGV
jgi:6-phosphogluconolactonase (cycloisomerase 2 family)